MRSIAAPENLEGTLSLIPPGTHEGNHDNEDRWTTRFLAAAWLAIATLGAHAAADIRKETIQFQKGATSASIKGRLRGDADVDYRVRAGAGQTLAVALRKPIPELLQHPAAG